jgi:hypothetical protein
MIRVDSTIRWFAAPVALAVTATLLGGCRGSGTDSTGSPSSTRISSSTASSSSTPPGNGQADRCHTGDLRGSIGTVNGASGKRRVDVYLTNASNRACTLEGYPQVQPADVSGGVRSYPTRQSPNPGSTLPQDQSVHLVTLRPSMTAYLLLFFNGAWITEEDKKTCVDWTALAVTPPGEQDHLVIPNTDVACVDPIDIGPVQS